MTEKKNWYTEIGCTRLCEMFFLGVLFPFYLFVPDTIMYALYYVLISAPNCDTIEYDRSVGTIDFYSLVVENEYIFVQKSVDDNTSLYVSYNRGPFKKAFFPLKLHPLVNSLFKLLFAFFNLPAFYLLFGIDKK